MRVDLNAGAAIPESATQKSDSSRTHAAEGEKREAGKSSNDGSLSPNEASLTSLAAAALHAPEVRTARVEALRTEIAAGNYHVSPHQIAASIVDQLRTRRPNGS
jgi:flagellar biosynthesis anti-sigma factor FlgM